MFEELNERRKAVERNIAKGFGMDDADLDFEKALEDELEKGRAKKQFNIGDTFTRHGITYKCTGISANTGRPTWSKVKDGEGGKQEQSEKKEEKKEESDNKFVPKHSFKNAKDMANKMNLYLDKNVSIQKFVDILGETVYDKGNGTNGRNLRVGSGMYGEWDSRSDSYLQKDMSGDYLEFKKKPSKEKLDECAKILKEQLAEEGYDVNPEFVVLPHNSYYQHSDTFGVGINIKVTKKEWQNSSKQEQPEKKDEQQKPKKLSELKRGDTVALIMERYNPQLGNYVTIKKVQIEGTTSKSFKVDYMKFDKETGERSDKSSSVYGSSTHYILLPEEVNSHIKDGKWKGDRISGGNPFEDE